MAERTGRARLALGILRSYVRIRIELRRHTVAEIVAAAPRSSVTSTAVDNPRRLSRAVSRMLLRGGERNVRCIHRALVLHRLLRKQGHPAVLVIGLPPSAGDHRAHAWVEIDGQDVGPAPGRSGHQALATYS